MSGGFVSPTTCGFAKVTALWSAKRAREFVKVNRDPAKTTKVQEHEQRYKFFCETFIERSEAYQIDFSAFCKRFPALQTTVKKWNTRKSSEKELFLKEFSVERWQSLSPVRKSEHSFSDCKGCYQSFASIQALFPVKSPLHKHKAKSNPFNVIRDITASELNGHTNYKPANKTAAISAAQNLYQQVNPVFKRWSGLELGETLCKVPEAGVEVKKTKTEKKRVRRKLLRETKAEIENHWHSTSLQRCLGNRQSFSSRQRERLASSFETKQAAKRKRESDLELERDGKKKKKKHTGNANTVGWDKEALLREVQGYEAGTTVNWSELARQYKVLNKNGSPAQNGGQIIQDLLVNQGIDIHQFKNSSRQQSGERRVRRRKVRGLGGEISLPTPETNGSLKETLKEKIASGEISVGELIVPKKFSKLTLNKRQNTIETVEFTVEGRKRPLEEIRKMTLEKQKGFMRQNTDSYYSEMTREMVESRLQQLGEYHENDSLASMQTKLQSLERTRHLAVWHDHSSVANHGHLLFMVSVLYDPAVHLTTEEYHEKTGDDVNVQDEIEHPEVYIIAR